MLSCLQFLLDMLYLTSFVSSMHVSLSLQLSPEVDTALVLAGTLGALEGCTPGLARSREATAVTLWVEEEEEEEKEGVWKNLPHGG